MILKIRFDITYHMLSSENTLWAKHTCQADLPDNRVSQKRPKWLSVWPSFATKWPQMAVLDVALFSAIGIPVDWCWQATSLQTCRTGCTTT